MSTPTRRLCMVRMLALACLTLALATPAVAQFGGLKKKAEKAAGAEAAKKAGDTTAAQKGAAPAPAEAAGGNGAGGQEAVVLDEKLVDQFIAGLKAGEAEREAAKKEKTPYGQYQRDSEAYNAAKAKCDAAHETFTSRMLADSVLRERYSAAADKMIKAQEKQDQKGVEAYADSSMAIVDPACVVKQPKQPDDYYDAQRKVDSRAEEQAIKSSKMSRNEFAMAQERTWLILRGDAPPGDASASEKAAVNNRAAELKPLLGIEEKPAARAVKPAPAAAPAPAPVAPASGMSDDQMKTAKCNAKNAEKNQKEIEALGLRAQAAAEANDVAKAMAISDTIRQLQSAGCQ